MGRLLDLTQPLEGGWTVRPRGDLGADDGDALGSCAADDEDGGDVGRLAVDSIAV
jgi:hypothetical protein